jgi:hypothetical protein
MPTVHNVNRDTSGDRDSLTCAHYFLYVGGLFLVFIVFDQLIECTPAVNLCTTRPTYVTSDSVDTIPDKLVNKLTSSGFTIHEIKYKIDRYMIYGEYHNRNTTIYADYRFNNSKCDFRSHIKCIMDSVSLP